MIAIWHIAPNAKVLSIEPLTIYIDTNQALFSSFYVKKFSRLNQEFGELPQSCQQQAGCHAGKTGEQKKHVGVG
jgi:hypothetical protein